MYLAGGLAGELAGYAWQPRGAGNSVAVCGLAGGLLAALLLGREAKVSAIGAVLVPYWVAALVGYASESIVVGVGLCVLVAPLGFLVLRNGLSRPLAVFVGSAGVLGALTLLALHDIHGAALLAGALVGGAGILRRNPWSSMDVQREGGDAFRAAQAAYAEDIAKERAEAERERDFEAFRKTFVAEGGIGDEKVIRAAFETARAEQATQQAVAAEREGLLGERYRLGSLL